MSSSNLYNTFGNEVSYEIKQGVLSAYLENSSISFPLPQASAEILGRLSAVKADYFNPYLVEQVYTRLQKIGFAESTAKSFTPVLLQVAKAQGISVFEYFNFNDNSLNLAVDSYEMINTLRPNGNRIGLVSPKLNKNSRFANLIKP